MDSFLFVLYNRAVVTIFALIYIATHNEHNSSSNDVLWRQCCCEREKHCAVLLSALCGLSAVKGQFMLERGHKECICRMVLSGLVC